MTTVPQRPTLEGLEEKWDAVWQAAGTYRFDRSRPRSEVFSVDTPPPTVSGSLHLGTVFGYVQTDAVARFHRMRGRAVFYPMGWDDNGLPTERRVQNHYGVRCEPSLPYEPGLVVAPADPRSREQRPVSRPNFVELCHQLTEVDERAFEQVWRSVGLSVDWGLTYATIDDRSRRVAQRAFLRNLARGEAYQAEAPTLWDIDFRTAVAQAEVEERPARAAYHRLAFARADGGPVEIETTRPELLPACVALVTHPADHRYSDLVGTSVRTPVFGVEVPVLAHPLAEPDKGTGIAMICTFGDTVDVQWWRELSLPLRSVVRRDGRLTTGTPPWLSPADWDGLGGLTLKQARTRLVELLRAEGALLGEPRPVEHAVKFYEKGDRPLEIVTSRQWYVRNGSQDPALRADLLERGRELRWHPEHMRVRYEHWVDGLNTDWLISRQRYFGVPFPVWYPLSPAGEPEWDRPLVPAEDALPVDPQADPPPGYRAEQRGEPDGFIGDPDVMDTWATSSLTPQIACGWEDDPDLFAQTFPMDLRPQGPEIIRTWLFATMLRSRLEHGVAPWSDTAINGWILDPDRKKMSKSKGNVVTPAALVEQFQADGVRYWACRAAPGTDTATDTGQMKVGRRLALKVLNASKFVLGLGAPDDPAADDPAAGGPTTGGRATGGLTTGGLATGGLITGGLTSGGPVAGGSTTGRLITGGLTAGGPVADGPTPGGRVVGGPVAAGAVTDPVDRAMLTALAAVVNDATSAFEDFRYQRALERTESFFWHFCDDYLELVKNRAYRPDGGSARAALATALSVQIRLLAPVLPFACEEVWSWWQEGSVHQALWPTSEDLTGGDPAVLEAASALLADVRRAKTAQQRSLRSEVARVEVHDTPDQLAALTPALDDLRDAGAVARIDLVEDTGRSVIVELTPNG